MDAEINRLPHIRTAFVITDGLVARTELGYMTIWLSALRNTVVNMFISSTINCDQIEERS